MSRNLVSALAGIEGQYPSYGAFVSSLEEFRSTHFAALPPGTGTTELYLMVAQAGWFKRLSDGHVAVTVRETDLPSSSCAPRQPLPSSIVDVILKE